MKAGYPPIDIKFMGRLAYYNAFETYHTNGKPKDIAFVIESQLTFNDASSR